MNIVWSCPVPGCDEDLEEDGADLRCPEHGVPPAEALDLAVDAAAELWAERHYLRGF